MGLAQPEGMAASMALISDGFCGDVLQCCQLDSARGGFVGGMAIAPAFSSWTAVAREEAIGTVDTLPGMETEAEQNHALEEIFAGRAHCVGGLTSFAVNLTHSSHPMQLDAGCVRYFARGTGQILGWMLIRVARSALRCVGEFEDLSCDGQDDIDELGLPIALEVDAVVWGSAVLPVPYLLASPVCGSALASRRRNAPGRSTGVGGPGRSLLTRRRSRELP
jgi:hypothetical protein